MPVVAIHCLFPVKASNVRGQSFESAADQIRPGGPIFGHGRLVMRLRWGERVASRCVIHVREVTITLSGSREPLAALLSLSPFTVNFNINNRAQLTFRRGVVPPISCGGTVPAGLGRSFVWKFAIVM